VSRALLLPPFVLLLLLIWRQPAALLALGDLLLPRDP
jgi:hypothetical protein